MLLAAALLLAADPPGDTRGDGSYTLPSALIGTFERSLDLREFRAESVNGKLRLTVGMGGLDNPWHAPGGFSVALIDVFVKTDYGGARDLGDAPTDLRTPPGEGWQHRYTISGFGMTAQVADREGRVRPDPKVPRVSTSGSEIVLDTSLPPGRYSYWVTSRLYSPLTPRGSTTPRAGMPQAVDVLRAGDQASVYAARVLAPVGELRDRRPLALLALALGGLLLAVLATFRAWRRI